MKTADKKFYDDNIEKFLRLYRGKWIVIYNETVLGAWDTSAEAYDEGVTLAESVDILMCEVQPGRPEVHAPAMSLGILGGPVHKPT